VAGQLGDAVIRRRKDGRLLTSAATALVAAPLACVGVLQQRGAVLPAIIFLTLAYAALTTYYGLVYSAIQDLVAPNQRGITMAVYFMAMYLCGASFGLLLTGRISDLLAHRAAVLAGSSAVPESFRAIGLQQAMLIIPIFSAVLAGVLYTGSRTITSDIARRETLALEPLLSSD